MTRDVTSQAGNEPPLQSDDDQCSADTALATAPGIRPPRTFTTIDAACSPELLVLVEALVRSNGDSTLAAKEFHLSRRSFCSRLRKLGLLLSLGQRRGAPARRDAEQIEASLPQVDGVGPSSKEFQITSEDRQEEQQEDREEKDEPFK